LGDAEGFAIQLLGGLVVPPSQQQLAFLPVQLRCEPAPSFLFDDLQSIVQQNHTLFNLPCDLTCSGQKGERMGRPHFRPGSTVSRRTAAQQRYPFGHITILDRDPAAMDRSHRTPDRETLLGRHRNQLVCPLIQRYVVSDNRKRQGAE
jgi:hypothetical protein